MKPRGHSKHLGQSPPPNSPIIHPWYVTQGQVGESVRDHFVKSNGKTSRESSIIGHHLHGNKLFFTISVSPPQLEITASSGSPQAAAFTDKERILYNVGVILSTITTKAKAC